MTHEHKPIEEWDDLDFLAMFEGMTSEEDLRLTDVQATAKHPEAVSLIAPKDQLTVKVEGERTYVVLNAPTDGAINLAQACLHVNDHQCQQGANILNMFVQGVCKDILKALKKSGREVKLEGD